MASSLHALPFRIRPSILKPVSAPTRAFTTSSPLSIARKYIPRPTPSKYTRRPPPYLRKPDETIPPYPYPNDIYKPANSGLYGGQRVRFGNNRGKIFKTKTNRIWKPNAQWKRIYSVALGQFIRLHITTKVMRTVDKSGGLDRYLLGETPARIRELGPYGWLLRMRVMRTEWGMDFLRTERKRLGVPEDGLPLIGNSLRWVELPPKDPDGKPRRRALPVGGPEETEGVDAALGEFEDLAEELTEAELALIEDEVSEELYAGEESTRESSPTTGRKREQFLCYNCGGEGHMSRNCPVKAGEEATENELPSQELGDRVHGEKQSSRPIVTTPETGGARPSRVEL